MQNSDSSVMLYDNLPNITFLNGI